MAFIYCVIIAFVIGYILGDFWEKYIDSTSSSCLSDKFRELIDSIKNAKDKN